MNRNRGNWGSRGGSGSSGWHSRYSGRKIRNWREKLRAPMGRSSCEPSKGWIWFKVGRRSVKKRVG